MASKRVAVVLSGCGVYDGAEIHEATLTLYFLDRAGATAVCMAPNIEQHHVVNHLNGQETGEKRNVLKESARIARGNIVDLATVSSDSLDALIIPGGFGVAKNLSSLVYDGPDAWVDENLSRLIKEMHEAKKPIGALCISPAMLSLVLANKGITLTIGNDSGTVEAIQTMGNYHKETTANAIVVDEANKVVSTAAYMCAASIAEAAVGIEQLVTKILSWA